MTVRIREATPEDRERIVLFNFALAHETEGRELDRRRLRKGVEALLADPGKGRYFVAELGGEIAGQIGVTYEWSDWRNGFVWWIQSVYVSRPHRGRGVYAALHRHVRQLARREKVVGLRLYVERDNEPARRAYASLGMKESTYDVLSDMWA